MIYLKYVIYFQGTLNHPILSRNKVERFKW